MKEIDTRPQTSFRTQRGRSKYNAHRVEVKDPATGDTRIFASAKEAKRYKDLLWAQECGLISGLRCQVRYQLIPQQRRKSDGKAELAAHYIADFVYTNPKGETVVEDVKGYREGIAYQLFVLKRKLMLQVHGIEIKEV